ncbi:MAG TPA: quinone oxidoreductase [Gemmatimonadaceae bacterium]|nr:quinone oxidoreductase [Gemmatimonadaceae bacterium]
MKAIRVREHGDAGVLRLEDVPEPRPGPDEALVHVEAAGVNFIEIYQRQGLYPMKLPFTPGREGAGTVVAVGNRVSSVRVGDRVASESLHGSYAELATASADRLVALPEGLTMRDGAAVMLQGMTAHYLATSTYALAPGDWCLVHAAAGGVGLLLCQLAARRGARVIGTTSTDEKAALARAAGAHEVIDYTRQDFVAEARRLTDGGGVRVVYDSVGRTTFEGSLDALAPRGMLVLFGQSSGPVPPFEPQILNRKGSLFLTRPSLAHYVATRDELLRRAADVLGWVGNGSLHVRVDRALPLGEAAESHLALEERKTMGKLLLIP